MTEHLERRYRRLMLAYPGSYRRERGDEILATLLDMSAPDRRWPAPREVAGLLFGAAGTRVRMNLSRPAREVWAGGLRLAALILLAQACAQAAAQAGLALSWLSTTDAAETVGFVVATVLSAGALLGVGSGRYRLGFAAVAGAFAAEAVGSHGHRDGPATMFAAPDPYFWPLAFALLACAALVLARPSAGRGLPWLFAVPLAVLLFPNQFYVNEYVQPYGLYAFLTVCLLSTVVDSRVPVAGAAACLPSAAIVVYQLLTPGWYYWDAPWPFFGSVIGVGGLLLASVPLGRLAFRSWPTSAR